METQSHTGDECNIEFFGSIGAMLREERLLHGLCQGLRAVSFRGAGGLLCR